MTNITPRFENLPFVNKSSFLNLINLFLLRKRSISGILIQKFKKYRGYIDFYDYLELIISFISEKSIILKPSGYLNYYDKKGENADYLKKNEWSVKQKNIYKILLKTRPKTMLDFGANTGWFTFLAESLGISVIALDKEEDCVDYIYKKAKSEKKKILPLLISYSDLNREYYGKKIDRPDLKENDYSKVPIYCSPIKRLSTEIVLCLGLIHHLTLGEGDTILSIFKNISQLAQKYLIIEYVDLNDQLIAGNSSYFKNIHKFTKQTYNINLIIEAGKLYFRDIEIYDSNPETRKLILFSNKITS
jgi:SAM-dependent methyltransferase